MAQPAQIIGKNRQHFETILSTHQYLADYISNTNPPEGFCVTSDYQSGGKGQIGRNWHSESGKNLLVSYVVYPTFLPPAKGFRLNIWVSVSLVRTLANFGIQNLSIKWPNDIYIGEKKVAGILIQNTLRGEEVKSSLVSVGLNVNEVFFPPHLPNPVSMASISGCEFDTQTVFEKLNVHLENNYHVIKHDPGSTWLDQAYREYLFGKDEWYAYKLENGVTIHARVHDVLEDGKIVLETNQGNKETFTFHQITWLGKATH